jgi:hypothetical protein
MVLFDLHKQRPGIILEDSVTAEATAELTGYITQHIRRLAMADAEALYRASTSPDRPAEPAELLSFPYKKRCL